MGTLIRALAGFAIACALLYPEGLAHQFDTPRWAGLRHEIASQHPTDKLAKLMNSAIPGRYSRYRSVQAEP